MKKLRQKRKNAVASTSKDRDTVKTLAGAVEHPVFSFRFLTSNAKHNLKAIDASEAQALLFRLQEIGKRPWRFWFEGVGKIAGLELLPYTRLKFRVANDQIIDGDMPIDLHGAKAVVFRFDHQKGRIIGVKGPSSATYYVVGFDVDFSAYDHT